MGRDPGHLHVVEPLPRVRAGGLGPGWEGWAGAGARSWAPMPPPACVPQRVSRCGAAGTRLAAGACAGSAHTSPTPRRCPGKVCTWEHPGTVRLDSCCLVWASVCRQPPAASIPGRPRVRKSAPAGSPKHTSAAELPAGDESKPGGRVGDRGAAHSGVTSCVDWRVSSLPASLTCNAQLPARPSSQEMFSERTQERWGRGMELHAPDSQLPSLRVLPVS